MTQHGINSTYIKYTNPQFLAWGCLKHQAQAQNIPLTALAASSFIKLKLINRTQTYITQLIPYSITRIRRQQIKNLLVFQNIAVFIKRNKKLSSHTWLQAVVILFRPLSKIANNNRVLKNTELIKQT